MSPGSLTWSPDLVTTPPIPALLFNVLAVKSEGWGGEMWVKLPLYLLVPTG